MHPRVLLSFDFVMHLAAVQLAFESVIEIALLISFSPYVLFYLG